MSSKRTTTPKIDDLKVSFIWVETIPELLSESEHSGPLALIARDYFYDNLFSDLVAGMVSLAEPRGLSLPWPSPSGHFFWHYYFERKRISDVKAKQARNGVVPFRGSTPIVSTQSDFPGDLTLEAFYYPHGIALVMTAGRLREKNLSLEKTVGVVHSLRYDDELRVTWDTGESEVMSLNALADRCLARIRESAFGPDVESATATSEPFTVCTVVSGSGADRNVAAEAKGEVHHALEALTGWNRDWRGQGVRLSDFDKSKITLRAAGSVSDVLYGSRRGRAVWFPRYFTEQSGDLSSLSCYHRNLVLMSLQVESLGGLIAATAKQFRENRALPDWHRDWARRASGTLGRIYGGVRNETYRSMSARVQIEQNDLTEDVNLVRARFNMPNLS